MSDPFRKVRPGEPLAFSAAARNELLDAAREPGAAPSPPGGSARSGWLARVLNDTGADLAARSVVGLGGPILGPGDSADAFLREPTFRGVVPTAAHADRFGVLPAPIPSGRVGRAYVAGAYQARVDVSDAGHTCAVAAAGETSALASADQGAAQILWREGGTGTQWAVIRHAAACEGGTGPVPDDGTGCCSFLPEADIPGSLGVTTYSGGTPIDSATIAGPFAYYPGGVEILLNARFGSSVYPTYLGEDGYYIAGPACLTDRVVVTIQVGGEFGAITTDRLFNRRYYAIIACTWDADAETSADKKVRLILVSNFGQSNDTSAGEPETCNDQEGGPFGDFADEWQWVVDPSGTDYIIADGAFVVNERRSPAHPGGFLATCDPLCLVFDGSGPVGQSSLRFEGTAGEIPCTVPDPDDCACTTTITVVSYCPDECPEEGGALWSLYARDDETLEDFGPGPVRWSRNEADECLIWSATVEVCLPPDEITGDPPASRTFSLRRVQAGVGDTDLGDAVVEGCLPVVLSDGLPPDLFAVRFRLIGCPSPLVLPDAPVSVEFRHTTGELIDTRSATTGADGVGYAIFSLPAAAGSYRFDLVVSQPYPGYAGTVTFSPEALPAAGTECFELDLGDATAPADEDHVCTCGGLVQRCITWDGNGSPVELHWDGSKWVGLEWEAGVGLVNDGFVCLDEGGFGTSELAVWPVELSIGEAGDPGVCTWSAARTTYACFCGGDFEGTPCLEGDCTGVVLGQGTPRQAGGTSDGTIDGDPIGTGIGSIASAVATPWGPTGVFPGVTLSPWTRPGGEADPGACFAPARAYEPAEANNCTAPPAPMMALRSAPVAEPPLPSPLRMAGQLARTAGAAIARKARGGTTLASTEAREARWAACRACDHFRPSDLRCGGTGGCGCWLAKKIPVAAASCPLDPPAWGPEPPRPDAQR